MSGLYQVTPVLPHVVSRHVARLDVVRGAEVRKAPQAAPVGADGVRRGIARCHVQAQESRKGGVQVGGLGECPGGVVGDLYGCHLSASYRPLTAIYVLYVALSDINCYPVELSANGGEWQPIERQMTDEGDWITVPAAAQRLGVSERTGYTSTTTEPSAWFSRIRG